MRLATIVVALGAAAIGGPAFGETEKCFDKGTLTYVDCPQPAPVAVAPPPAPVPPAPAPYAWGGFYIGGFVAFGGGDDDVTVTQVAPVVTVGQTPSSLNSEPDGFGGGATIGHNTQFDEFVVGVEADFAITDIEGAASFTSPAFPPPTLVTSEKTEIDWLSTVRARAGVTLTPELLAFATGGLAIADVERSGTAFENGNGSFFSYSDDSVRVGWTIGGGLEYGLTEALSLRADYLYVDLGSENNLAAPANAIAGALSPNGAFSDRDDLKFHFVRVGANYGF